NQRCVELIGRAREAQVGHRFTEWFPEEMAAGHLASFHLSTTDSGASAAQEIAIPRPDGSTVYVDFHNRLVQVGDEQVVFSIGRDVTERRRVAQELQLLHSVAAATSEANDLPSVLRVLLSSISDSGNWKFSSAWLPDPRRDVIEPRCLWMLGGKSTDQYRSEVPQRLARGDGLVGGV